MRNTTPHDVNDDLKPVMLGAVSQRLTVGKDIVVVLTGSSSEGKTWEKCDVPGEPCDRKIKE